jgi:hypothetical protein
LLSAVACIHIDKESSYTSLGVSTRAIITEKEKVKSGANLIDSFVIFFACLKIPISRSQSWIVSSTVKRRRILPTRLAVLTDFSQHWFQVDFPAIISSLDMLQVGTLTSQLVVSVCAYCVSFWESNDRIVAVSVHSDHVFRPSDVYSCTHLQTSMHSSVDR